MRASRKHSALAQSLPPLSDHVPGTTQRVLGVDRPAVIRGVARHLNLGHFPGPDLARREEGRG